MSKRKKQVYVVVRGRRPGLYPTWYGAGGAAEQVEGFADAVYRGFYEREEALAWLREFDRETLANLAPNLLDLVESAPAPPEAEDAEALLAAGKVLVYTDGGALDNPGPGGYGVVLRYQDKTKELSAGYRLTTNNRMELMACIAGLEALRRPCSVVVFSDSKYVVNGMVEGWAERWVANAWRLDNGQEVKNADLWRRLLAVCDRHEVEFRWVRGHAGNRFNERCDQLAVRAASGRKLAVDAGFEAQDSLQD